MATYEYKKLNTVEVEDNFNSNTSKHFIVEDGNSIKRLEANSVFSEPFVVTLSGTSEEENASCDKTFAEIKEALNANMNVVFQYEDIMSVNSKSIYHLLPQYIYINNELFSIFLTFYAINTFDDVNNGLTSVYISIGDGSVSINFTDI